MTQNAGALAWGGIMLVLMLGIGAIMLDNFQATVENDTTAYTIIGSGLTGLQSLGDLQTLIFVMIGLAVVVGLFAIFNRGGQQ
jgi:hypothetical protein